jgi:general secretion pathway protein A
VYLSHFGFLVTPFNVTPDPGFLYLSPGHKEALGAVRYGVEQRKGLVTIVGEVGTGKTTILRAFLERHTADNVKPIYILDPRISFEGILRITLDRFNYPHTEKSSSEELITALHDVLLREYEAGNTVALLIDEAQRLSLELLENLRLLTNLETNKEKLFQIVLVGQPELGEMLSSKELRQVNQRVAVRAHLEPLSPRESAAYIAHRLQRATRIKKNVFTPGAVKKIVAAAGGIPRNMNIICDNVLVSAYANDELPVTSRRVRRVLRNAQSLPARPSRMPRALALGVLLLLAGGAGATLTLVAGPPAIWSQRLPRDASAATRVEESAGSVSTNEVGEQPQAAEVVDERPLETASAVPATQVAEAMQEKTPATNEVAEDRADDTGASMPQPAPAVEVDREDVALPPIRESLAMSLPTEEAPQSLRLQGELLQTQEERDPPEARLEADEPAEATPVETPEPAPAPTEAPLEANNGARVWNVRPGDTLTGIAAAAYGLTDRRVLAAILAENPQVSNANVIFRYDQLILPEISQTPFVTPFPEQGSSEATP